MSLLDQFEVQFNELSDAALLDGDLSELQPVEIAGILNQELNRIQMELSPSEKVDKIQISLSEHDYKRLLRFETLLVDGLENFLKKNSELKRIDAVSDTKIEILKDSTLEDGIAKSIPVVSSETEIEEIIEIQEGVITRLFVLEINGLKRDLIPGTYYLGRGTDVDIQINDSGISRKHLAIHVDEIVKINDLNSTNGTFLGSERVMEILVEESVSFRAGVTEIKIARETR